MQRQRVPVHIVRESLLSYQGNLNTGISEFQQSDSAVEEKRAQEAKELFDLAGRYEIQTKLDGETPRRFVFLAPPEQVLVRRADDTWYRRRRHRRKRSVRLWVSARQACGLPFWNTTALTGM